MDFPSLGRNVVTMALCEQHSKYKQLSPKCVLYVMSANKIPKLITEAAKLCTNFLKMSREAKCRKKKHFGQTLPKFSYNETLHAHSACSFYL